MVKLTMPRRKVCLHAAALKEYSPADIYNADETALFYKLMPNKTLEFKGNKCFWGKSSKEGITALLCTNSTGTDKLKPLKIGKFGQPRCFKRVQHLPFEYRQGMDDIRGIRRVVVVPGTLDEGPKEENSSHHGQLLLS